jgi:hypothetical protein
MMVIIVKCTNGRVPPWSFRGGRQAMFDLNEFVKALSRNTRGGEVLSARLFSIRGLFGIIVMQANFLASSSK